MGVYSFDDFQDYHQPYCWWGYHFSAPHPLSVVQLIQANSMDASLAALLWLMLEQRTSLIVAADPPLSGKSTTLTALLDFLPPAAERIYLRGASESFEFVGRVPPARAYILCNEISPDLPTYTWGRQAAMVFQLMGQGYPLGSTMHAGTIEKLLAILERELAIPRPLIARLTLVLFLDRRWQPSRSTRRVHSLHLLQARRDGEIATSTLAQRTGDGLEHRPGEALRFLETEAGLPVESAGDELERRREFLEGLHRNEVADIADVRAAILGYLSRHTES